jgi:LuxR family maltose regulon positive regulatory protein
MIGAMGPAAGSDGAAGRVARPGAGGVVSRPRLFERLAAAARVTVVSAPPGSGKTVLLRSWISEADVAGSAAWVPVGRGERDPQQFWLSVLGALRQTAPGSALVHAVTAAPVLDGQAIVERLLTDLAPLRERIWLVIDDMHELGTAEALRQLELLMMRAPPGLRFVLATRHDVRLGLHRLRLEGELAEIREHDLQFTLEEARELFDAAGVELPDAALLVERTEGWAAGLRLAALSLAGHPDPERFAAEFSGSERTVAEYLLAEVLERQSEEVRQLLLRTSVLERVNGELADLLTGDSSGERVLQDLVEANAFVVALDAARSWFRYHYLFADLLQRELRRTAPGEVAALHRAAAGWFARHGFPVEAVRHAQGARLDRRAARQPRQRGTRSRAGLAGTARGGRALAAAGRTRPQRRGRARGGTGDPLHPRGAGAGARPGRRRAGRFPGRRAVYRTARRTEPARHGGAGNAGANPGTPGRDRACRAGHRRARRARSRTWGDSHLHRDAAARPG